MGMTRYELCVHACKFAVGELMRRNNTAFVTPSQDGMQQISLDKVMEWLDQEQEKAEWCKKM